MDSSSKGALRLPAIFSEHMVLRAERPNPIWGWAAAGSEVTVAFQGQTKKIRADASGRWRLDLPPAPAGGPYPLQVSSGPQEIVFSDVLAGEVWLCSGQSNMEWTVAMTNHAEKEIASGNHPRIRLLHIPRVASPEAQSDVDAAWTVCSAETVTNFSAVGYFFGRELHQTQKTPIGLISSSWGGSPAEAWTEWGFLEGEEAFAEMTAGYLKFLRLSEKDTQRNARLIQDWSKVERFQDPGNRAYFFGWADPETDEAEWRDFQAPGLWQNQGMPHNGAVWFRKKITVPAEWQDQDLVLSLGALDDFDEAYFNGEKVGATGQETPNWWATPRRYKIPRSLVRPGQLNTVTVRIFDDFGSGGFSGGAPLALYPENTPPASGVKLDGIWKCRVEYALVGTTPPVIQAAANQHNSPANLYNGMIAPFVPYGLSGATWYQGESNAERAEQYKILMTRMIESWRKAFENPDMPFLFVLLANYQPVQAKPVEGGWGEIREAQLEALKLPRTGVASAIDVGDAGDIHPRDKQTVGHRLALVARALVYGEKLTYSGPAFTTAKREGNHLRLLFSHAGSGLTTRDGEPVKGFAVRGSTGPWLWAEAEIQGDAVTVWNRDLPEIKEIRYAWASNPIGNLSNKEGLPALPFRSDVR